MAASAVPPPDFSLVLGGPLYQLFRRTRLAGDALELVQRRVVGIPLLAWVPLLLLSVVEGKAWSGVEVPFLYDIEQHARFLLAVPLMVVAELVVHLRMRPVVGQFMARHLVADAEQGAFVAAVSSAMKWRNSLAAELFLLSLVIVVGGSLASQQFGVLQVPTWHAAPQGGSQHLTLAGWWFTFVSKPLFQFLLLRWYFRLFIWARFLWQVSRLNLCLNPLHPDRVGGLGFLGTVSYAFAPLLLAQGVLLSGMMANRIFYEGAQFMSFRLELLGLVAFMLLTVLGPLVVFAPALERAQRAGLAKYGTLAQQYVREFEQKWLTDSAPGEPLVGSADIQSLADLGNSFEVVKGMRFAPINVATVMQLALTTLIPTAPLLLTMISLEQLVDRLLQVVL